MALTSQHFPSRCLCLPCQGMPENSTGATLRLKLNTAQKSAWYPGFQCQTQCWGSLPRAQWLRVDVGSGKQSTVPSAVCMAQGQGCPKESAFISSF